VGSAAGFGESGRGVCNRVCNGVGHNLARVGTGWHGLPPRAAVGESAICLPPVAIPGHLIPGGARWREVAPRATRGVGAVSARVRLVGDGT
jgi:hypothetical protein